MSKKIDIESEIYKSYLGSPYSTVKQSTYFSVYDELFKKFKNKEITFLEVGVLDGGSLFMWRDYLGSQARIIGVDLNPEAKKWKKDGFEIFIGDQSKESFWNETLNSIGKVDVILDDGGHTFEQQIMTAESTLPYINDGGIIVIEDCCTSYMKKFGFKKLSFINYAKKLIDNVNKRYMEFDNLNSEKRIWSVQFFESIVAFHVNFSASNLKSERTFNQKEEFVEKDFRYASYPLIIDKLEELSNKRNYRFFRVFLRLLRKTILNIYFLKSYISLKKYLKSKNII